MGIAGSYWLEPWAEQLRQTFKVQDPADQVRLLPDAMQTAPTEATEAVPVLALTKELLDLLPASLRQLIAEAPPPHADARVRALVPTRLGGNMRRDPQREQRFDECLHEEALVGAERGGAEAKAPLRPLQQSQAARPLRADERKISASRPSRIRWRFSITALTV